MELALQSSCLVKKPPSSSLHSFKPRLIVKATTDSSSEEATKPNVKTSVGFGSSSSSSVQTKDGKKGKRSKEKRSVIRRTPLEKPDILPKERETQTPEQSSAESAFLLTWFGLGSLIIIEGLVLAASGLFPEEWDKYLVKYLYPSFTLTVFLFVAGTVVYGVSKYLQGENMKS